MGLGNRLRRLEQYINPDKCPECGWPWTKYDDLDFDVCWRTVGDPEPEPKFCPRCGRSLTIAIRWLTTTSDETSRTE
jgi:membrane protease subunit (stomatin/prohibitin family)